MNQEEDRLAPILAFHDQANLALKVALIVAVLWPFGAVSTAVFLRPSNAQTIVPIIELTPLAALLFAVIGAPFALTVLFANPPAKKGFLWLCALIGVELSIGVYFAVVPVSNDPGLIPLLILASCAIFFLRIAQYASWLSFVLTLLLIGTTVTFFVGGRVELVKKLHSQPSPSTSSQPDRPNPAQLSAGSSAPQAPPASMVQTIPPPPVAAQTVSQSERYEPLPPTLQPHFAEYELTADIDPCQLDHENDQLHCGGTIGWKGDDGATVYLEPLQIRSGRGEIVTSADGKFGTSPCFNPKIYPCSQIPFHDTKTAFSFLINHFSQAITDEQNCVIYIKYVTSGTIPPRNGIIKLPLSVESPPTSSVTVGNLTIRTTQCVFSRSAEQLRCDGFLDWQGEDNTQIIFGNLNVQGVRVRTPEGIFPKVSIESTVGGVRCLSRGFPATPCGPHLFQGDTAFTVIVDQYPSIAQTVDLIFSFSSRPTGEKTEHLTAPVDAAE